MSQRVQPERAAKDTSNVVLPTEYKAEEIKLGSARTWGKTELRCLRVVLCRGKPIDLNPRVLKVQESDWPDELQTRTLTTWWWLTVGVDEEAAKLGSIEMRDYDTGVIEERDVLKAAGYEWVGTINATLDVMRQQDSKVAARAKQKETAANRAASQNASQTHSVTGSITDSTPASSASTITRKRAAPDPIVPAPSTKRHRQAPSPPASPPEPKTPDQPTQLANPNLSLESDATNISGNTVELKDEETTKVLINRFLTDSLTILGNEFRRITWHRGEHKVELMHTYNPFFSSDSETKMQHQSC
jgi:hypothetical protein